MEKLSERLVTEGPLGAEDLEAATEVIREVIQMAQNKLKHQTNLNVLAETKNGLSHRIQFGGVGSPDSSDRTGLLRCPQRGIRTGSEEQEGTPELRRAPQAVPGD